MAVNQVSPRSVIPGRKTRRSKWGRQTLALYYGLKDPETPLYAKLPAFLSLVYLFSPIDLIPDFIPFAGWLDDLLIVPALMALSLRMFPPRVREASLAKADRDTRKVWKALIILVLIVLLALTGIFFLIRKMLA